MPLSGLAKAAFLTAERLPIVRHASSAAYDLYSSRASGYRRLYRGVYPDLASAKKSIPKNRFSGYDNEPSARRLLSELDRINLNDYPVLFWLSRLLPETQLLFDWGGYVGISYFSYARYLDYPDRLEWLVNDVPAVVELGRKIAAQKAAPHLRFTSSFDELEKAGVLLSAGSLHFIEDPFPLLRTLKLPLHILVNKAPLYENPTAITLQNMGTAFCVNYLFNRSEFVQNFLALGYEMIDCWKIDSLACRIPFHRKHSIPAYSGFYFRRKQL